MPSIRDYAITEQITASASVGCEMPIHQSGDFLLAFATTDSAAITSLPPAGWSAIQDWDQGAFHQAAWYMNADSSNETLTVTNNAADEWHVTVIAIKDVHATSPLEVSGERAVTDNIMPFAGVTGVETSNANCLIFYGLGSDSGLSPTAYPPMINLVNGDAGSCSQGVAYTYMPSAGPIPECVWYGRANDDTGSIVVAVRGPNPEVTIQGYADRTLTSGAVLDPLVGASTTLGKSWAAALSFAHLGDDWEQAWTYTSSVYGDVTSALNNATASDVSLGLGIGDIIYVGHDDWFKYATFNVATAGLDGVLAWEYWNGSSWSSTGMTVDNLTATGWRTITVPTTAYSSWTPTSVNGVTKYYIRGRITTAYSTGVVLTQGRKNGRSTTYDAAAAIVDAGTNPYTDATSLTPATSTTNLGGSQVNLSTAWDMDTGIIVGSFTGPQVRDLAIDPALGWRPAVGNSQPSGGLQQTFADASGNYASYVVHAKGNLSEAPDNRNVFAIDWNGSATPWAVRGSINKSAITQYYMTSAGFYGALVHYRSMISLISLICFAGGSTSQPLNFLDLEKIANSSVGIFPFFRRTGSAALIYAPLQFGGGDPVFLDVNLRTFQFPRVYDGVEYFDWNCAENVAGVKFYSKSTDEFVLTNCVFTSDSPYRWEWDSSSVTPSVLDFSGTNVVGATVTLRSVGIFSNMTFNNCSEIALNGAGIADSKIRDTRATTSQGAVAITSAGEGDGVDRIAFINNNDGDIGHSIRITDAGTYTFDGHTFSGGGPAERNFNTGTGVNSSTDIVTVDAAHGYADGDAVYYQDQGGIQNIGLTDGTLYYVNAQSATTLSFHTTKADAIADTSRVDLTSGGSETHYIYSAKADVYNNSGGAVTINVSGGDTPTVRNGSGASTNVVSSVTLSVKVIDKNNQPIQNAQTAIYRVSDDSQLMNEDTDVNGNATESYGGTTPADIYVRVRKSSTGDTRYVPASTTGTIQGGIGSSLTTILTEDTNA